MTILLQHRGETCNFPGLKGEDGKAPFQCWAFLLHVPLVLAFSSSSLLQSPGCFPCGRCPQQIEAAIPRCARRQSLARQAAADSSIKAFLSSPEASLHHQPCSHSASLPHGSTASAEAATLSKARLLQDNPFYLEPRVHFNRNCLFRHVGIDFIAIHFHSALWQFPWRKRFCQERHFGGGSDGILTFTLGCWGIKTPLKNFTYNSGCTINRM